jgi:fructose-bisphosphate aldolase class II
MIDASDVPFQENVILTKQAVDYAHRKEVWVQGELGAVKGLEEAMTLAEREPFMTKPEEAQQFVKETGVDTLAVAVGNVHGVVKMRQGMTHALDVGRLDEIRKAIPNTPLVLHGASGVSVETLQESFQHGIRIVNMNTELKLAFVNALRQTLQKDAEAYDPREIFKPSMLAVQDLVAAKLRALKSTGKANS